MPAPNRFNMLKFQDAYFSLSIPRKRNAVYKMQCSATQWAVVTGRHSRHKLLSFRLISVVCCRVFWCSQYAAIGTGTGTFAHPFAQCQRCTWSDFTNLPSKSYKHAACECTRQQEEIYVLFGALKCLNFFSFLSLSSVISLKISLSFARAIVWSSRFNATAAAVVIIVSRVVSTWFWRFCNSIAWTDFLVYIQIQVLQLKYIYFFWRKKNSTGKIIKQKCICWTISI